MFIFLIFLLETLTVATQGGSNKYPQFVLDQNKKHRYVSVDPSFFLYKIGVKGGIQYMDMFT